MTIKKGYADGPFGQLHYETVGDGEPVILIHQMVQSAVQFRPALPCLAARGIKAVAVDLPGYGMSTTPDHAPTMDEYASIVPSLLDHFGLSQAVIGGHHTGASAAAAAAHRYPEAVSKLVVHGVPYFTPDEMAKHAAGSKKAKPIADDGSHFKAIWDLFAGLGEEYISANVTHQSVLTYFLAGETEWHGHNAVFSHDIWAAFDAVKAPTLLITNTGDMLNPQDHALARARPDFEFKEIEGGTFQYVYDDAEPWAELVAEFVKRS